jgi:hypothetical protein
MGNYWRLFKHATSQDWLTFACSMAMPPKAGRSPPVTAHESVFSNPDRQR